MNSGEALHCRRRRRRGREEQWLTVGTAEASGELRELLSTVLYFCSFSSNSGECRRRRKRRRGRERAVAGGGNGGGLW